MADQRFSYDGLPRRERDLTTAMTYAEHDVVSAAAMVMGETPQDFIRRVAIEEGRRVAHNDWLQIDGSNNLREALLRLGAEREYRLSTVTEE